MCKFSKTKKSSSRKKDIASFHINLSLMNFALLGIFIVGLAAYSVSAVGNTAAKLHITSLYEQVADLSSTTNTLVMKMSEQEQAALTPEVVERLGMVKVGTIEYARGIGGEVAVR